ncbi:uncharacterized protein VTP21DRAFT_2106 [Calcarisporiella thermophila]|uniref:uncharacterized protein n=1 Tax=Calcarisporiella thermophila TaxID=911321 RepID=UPI0037440667
MSSSMSHCDVTSRELTISSSSPDDIQSMLGKFQTLTRRLENTKANIFGAVNSFYKEYLNTYQFCTDFQDEMSSLNDDINSLLEESTEAANTYKLAELGVESERDYQLLLKQLVDCQNDAIALLIISKLHMHLQEFDKHLEVTDFLSAGNSIHDMSFMLERLSLAKGTSSYDPSIYLLLKEDYIKKKSALKHRLDELFSAAISFEKKNNMTEMTVYNRILTTSVRNYYDNPVSLEILFIALQKLNYLTDKLKWLSSQLAEHFVTPIVCNPTRELSVMRSKLHGVQLRYGTAALTKETKDTKRDPELVFEKLIEVAEFVRFNAFKDIELADYMQEVEEEQVPVWKLFGLVWWEGTWKIIRKECLEMSIPSDYKLLSYYEKVAESGLKFEQRLRTCGFLPEDREDITNFFRNIEQEFARKKRTNILSTARDILMNMDQNTTEVTHATERGCLSILGETKEQPDSVGKQSKQGKEGLEAEEASFRLPTCHVSVQVQTLVEIVYQTLQEAENTDSKGNIELFYCARDLFDLYRAIIPVYYARAIEASPARTAIFHNDCLYICHHLAILGFQFRKTLQSVSDLSAPLDQTGTFVDMIPGFRRLSETIFLHQMRRQRDMIKTNLLKTEGFGGMERDDRFEAVEKGVKECLFQLGDLSKIWLPILPSEVYLKAMGILLNTLLDEIIQNILSLEVIALEARHQLRYIITVIGKANEWFVAKSEGGARQVEKMPVPKYVASWEKYWLLVTLFEADPKDIATILLDGKLSPAFSQAEVKRLVQLFCDERDRDLMLKKFGR